MLDSVSAIGELFKHFPAPVMAWWQQSGHLSLAFCNSAFAQLCAREVESMVNLPGSLLVPVDGQADPGPAITRSLLQGGILDMEVAVLVRGRPRRLRLLGQGIMVGGRQREHIFLAVARDVSEDVKQANAKATTERMLSAVIANIHLPLLMLTQDGSIILANPAAARFFNRTIDDLVGRNLSLLFTRQDWPAVSSLFQKGVNNGCEQRAGIRICTGKGIILDVEARGQPIGDIGGKTLRMLTFSTFDPPPPANRDGLTAMERALRDGGSILAGRVQIIGLDDMRTSFGEQWGHMRERALSIAEQTIRSSLTPADQLQRMPDDSFVINFSNLTEAEATKRAQHIADGVRSRLLGGIAADGQVEAAVTTFRPEELGGGLADDLAELLVRKLTARRDESRRHVQALLREAMKKATLAPRQMMRPEGYALPIQVAELAYPWRQQIAAAMSMVGDDANAAFEADVVTLSVAVDWGDLRRQKGTLVVPVRFENLMLPRLLDRYVDIVRNLPTELRQRVILHLVKTPLGIASSRIGNMVQTLGPHCSGVALELPAMGHMLDPMGNKVGIVSLSFEQLDLGDQQMPARLQRLVRTCHLRKMKVWIENVIDETHGMRLASLGVDMITLLN